MTKEYREWFIGNNRTIDEVERYWNKNCADTPMGRGVYQVRRQRMRTLWYEEYGRTKETWGDIEWFMLHMRKPPEGASVDTRDWLTDDDIPKIIAACRTRKQRLFMQFIVQTGWRVSEVTQAKSSNVQKMRGGIYQVCGFATKTNKPISGYIAVDLYRDILKEFGSDSELLFVTSNGKPYSRAYISNQITKIGKRAGYKISAHSLRHYFVCSNVESKGRSLHDISLSLGHSTPGSTINSYYHKVHYAAT